MAIVTRSAAKVFLQIASTDTSKDDLIDALIPEVEADFLKLRNKAFDASGAITIYPDGSSLVASQMIGFHMSDMMGTGGAMRSESIGSYSYTRDDVNDGYPPAIINRIDKYVSGK